MTASGDISVSSAAFMLHTSVSTFQYVARSRCGPPKIDESEKRGIIRTLAKENITYGYRHIRALLRRQCVFISKSE